MKQDKTLLKKKIKPKNVPFPTRKRIIRITESNKNLFTCIDGVFEISDIFQAILSSYPLAGRKLEAY